jgi:hypothetical protein
LGTIDFPEPDDIRASICELVASGTPIAKEILIQAKLAHGSSFYRGIFPPSVKGSSDEKVKEIRLRTVVLELNQRLTQLTRQLAETSENLSKQTSNR